jgi:hypothetical protein
VKPRGSSLARLDESAALLFDDVGERLRGSQCRHMARREPAAKPRPDENAPHKCGAP